MRVDRDAFPGKEDERVQFEPTAIVDCGVGL